MTDIEYKEAINSIIYLCSCAIEGTAPELSKIHNLDHLYKASQKHMLTAMVGLVLQDAGISSRCFKNAVALASYRAILFEHDLDLITSALEKAEIWYMPLKGTVIKKLYPGFAMREMCDQDILFDAARAEDVRAIMEKLGFKATSYGETNDDDYSKPPVSYVEMHRSLFDQIHDKRFYEYYKNVKTKLVTAEGSKYCFCFTPEDFYIFMISHEYKHYRQSGTGLRSLLDTYIYLRSNVLDFCYVTNEMEKLGISDFEKQNRNLSLCLFSGQTLTEIQERMLDYIIYSGTFGTSQHNIENKVIESGGKWKYIIRRLFGPIGKDDPFRESFINKYKLFFKYPFLLPLLPSYRFCKAILNNPGYIKNEAEILSKKNER